MEANKILSADFLDILFEGRNKSYGAYELRKTYNSRMTKALIAIGALLLVLLLGSVLANKMNSTAKEDLNVVDTQMAEVKKDVPPPLPPPPPPPTPPPPPVIKQIQFTPPKIVPDKEVKPDEKIQEIKDDAVISTKTVESDNTKQVVQAPVEDKGTQVVEVPVKKVEEDHVFAKVEIESQFPGGDAAWQNFLRKNLDAQVPTEKGAPAGAYKVIVQFIVGKDGSIRDIKPETSLGYGMEEELLRVIRKGPKWTPGIQNGNSVTSIKRQPVSFIVTED